MHILSICGSVRNDSKTYLLLQHINKLIEGDTFEYFDLNRLPPFHPDRQVEYSNEEVDIFKHKVKSCDALVIATPEYIHNIPAILKSALEWVTESGELKGKTVLPITYTPHNPRGKKAMQSLLWSLKALEANIPGSLELYHTDLSFDADGNLIHRKGEELLRNTLSLLEGS